MKTIGGGPAARNAASSGGRPRAFSSRSWNAKPHCTDERGQSACGAANARENSTRCRCGETMPSNEGWSGDGGSPAAARRRADRTHPRPRHAPSRGRRTRGRCPGWRRPHGSSHGTCGHTDGSSAENRTSGCSAVEAHGRPRFSATIGTANVSGWDTSRSASRDGGHDRVVGGLHVRQDEALDDVARRVGALHGPADRLAQVPQVGQVRRQRGEADALGLDLRAVHLVGDERDAMPAGAQFDARPPARDGGRPASPAPRGRRAAARRRHRAALAAPALARPRPAPARSGAPRRARSCRDWRRWPGAPRRAAARARPAPGAACAPWSAAHAADAEWPGTNGATSITSGAARQRVQVRRLLAAGHQVARLQQVHELVGDDEAMDDARADPQRRLLAHRGQAEDGAPLGHADRDRDALELGEVGAHEVELAPGARAMRRDEPRPRPAPAARVGGEFLGRGRDAAPGRGAGAGAAAGANRSSCGQKNAISRRAPRRIKRRPSGRAGSSASRRPSPRKLNANSVSASARPGKIVSQGKKPIICAPSETSTPHDASGGCTPSPRNDRNASCRMIAGIVSVE